MKVIINKMPLAYVKGDLEKIKIEFGKVLYFLIALSIVFNTVQDFVFGIKATLIFLISIVVAKESEIFFLTMKSNIKRLEAKEAILTTKPEITGMIFALLLPVGTPLFVVAVGSFMSIFVGKMIFGGYSFNIFNPAIVGRLFVSIAWPALVTINFPNILDNYLLGLIFQRDFSETILTPLMELQANGIVSLANMKSLQSLLFLPNSGMLYGIPGVIYLGVLVFLLIKRTVDLRPFLVSLLASSIILLTIKVGFNISINYLFFNLLTGGFLFVTLFMMTDPFTKPFNNYGIIFYSVIFSIVFTLIRFLGTDSDGVLNALLFTNLFVPLLNKKTKKSNFSFNIKSFVTVSILIITLLGTGLFINSILNQRIVNGEIMVNAYVEN